MSILSTHKKLGFRNVPHHFQIALLLAVESLTIWTTYTTFFNLRNLFTAFSNCCDIIMHLVSLTAIKSTKQE